MRTGLHRSCVRFPIAPLAPLACGLGLLLMPAVTQADVTLTSSDGRWSALIEDTGGGAGQCNGLYDLNMIVISQRQFVANTLHYLRMGTLLNFADATSQRMQDTFHLLGFANSSDAFTATLASDDAAGVIAIVHGEMISGAAGGLRVSISFADTDPSDLLIAQKNIKPFVYANMNVDGQMLNNMGGWDGDHFHQSHQGGGGERWFIGRDSSHHSSKFNSTMQQLLDNGVSDLDDFTVGGPGDINTSMSFAVGALSGGSVRTIAYALGNHDITVPATFGLPPNAGSVGLQSSDGRWGGTIRTGLGYADEGSAGEIGSISDFNRPLATASFGAQTLYYLAASTTPQSSGSKVKDVFERVTFLYPTQTTSMASAVLNSKQWPGLVMMIDTKMIDGNAGGLVTSLKFADTLNRGLKIAPLVLDDLDVDAQQLNTGGFVTDHFMQASTLSGGSTRWFKAASHSSRQSSLLATLQTALDAGATVLPNTVSSSSSNLAAAFAFEPWTLHANQAYVTGFAVGNPNIDIPVDFVFPSVWFTCPADIAPAQQGDGQVNVSDLLAVITTWGSCPSAPAACGSDIVPHFVGDGVVNVSDLLEVITHWGACFAK